MIFLILIAFLSIATATFSSDNSPYQGKHRRMPVIDTKNAAYSEDISPPNSARTHGPSSPKSSPLLSDDRNYYRTRELLESVHRSLSDRTDEHGTYYVRIPNEASYCSHYSCKSIAIGCACAITTTIATICIIFTR